MMIYLCTDRTISMTSARLSVSFRSQMMILSIEDDELSVENDDSSVENDDSSIEKWWLLQRAFSSWQLSKAGLRCVFYTQDHDLLTENHDLLTENSRFYRSWIGAWMLLRLGAWSRNHDFLFEEWWISVEKPWFSIETVVDFLIKYSQAPSYNASERYALFFIIFTLLGGFFITNLFVGVRCLYRFSADFRLLFRLNPVCILVHRCSLRNFNRVPGVHWWRRSRKNG